VKSHTNKDFRKCFKELPKRIQKQAKENYMMWKENPHYPSLGFKRVGKNYPIYSVRVGLGWRALGIIVVVWDRITRRI